MLLLIYNPCIYLTNLLFYVQLAQIYCDCYYDFNIAISHFNTSNLTLSFLPLTGNVSSVLSCYFWHSLLIFFSSFYTPEDAYVSESAKDFLTRLLFYFQVDYFPNCVFTEKVKLNLHGYVKLIFRNILFIATLRFSAQFFIILSLKKNELLGKNKSMKKRSIKLRCHFIKNRIYCKMQSLRVKQSLIIISIS